jgi:DsbC/DsbD-like thiol-disulfide interchange protein
MNKWITSRLRKSLASVFVLGLVLVAFVGCGPSGDSQGDASPAIAAPADVPKHMRSDAHVSVSVEPVSQAVSPGQEYELTLLLEIAEGWHINANPASFDYLIPTKLSLEKTSGLRLVSVNYPKGEPYQFGGLEKPLIVYEKTVRIPFRVAVARGATPGSLAVAGQVSVQACDDKSCLVPSQIPVRFALEIN